MIDYKIRYYITTIIAVLCAVVSPKSLAEETSSPTIGFYGAARCYGGSCHLLNTGSHKILLDCGSFMSKSRIAMNSGLQFQADSVDLVTLSHAHTDHCGRLPVLYGHGYTGGVLCARPTGELTKIMLHVQENIHKSESQVQKNYSKNDLIAATTNLMELDYNEPFTFAGDTEITFQNAGHILGSAMTRIEFGPAGQRKTLVFSGDFGNNNNGIIQPKAMVKQADYLVIESTYGGKVRNDSAAELADFYRMLRDTASDNGVVLIPAFVLARTQKVLGNIYRGIETGQVPDYLNVYVDSPTASRITRIYGKYTDHLLKPFQGSAMGTWSPFSFKSLFLHRNFSKIHRPAVIIAPSADLSAGKIRSYLKSYVSDPNCRICFVSSYHPPGSLSGKIHQGARQIELDGSILPVRARVHQFGSFSGHGDQNQILEWMRKIQGVKQVFIVHGDYENMKILAGKIRSTFGWNVTIPKHGQTVLLD